MTSLNQPSPCKCCSTIRDHIAQHYDPGGYLEGTEDAGEIMENFEDVFELEADEDEIFPLSFQNIEDYLEEQRIPLKKE